MKANQGFVRDNSGASEVLGTVLLIGITVALMGSLTLLVLNVRPPTDILHADLSMSANRGLDGAWGTSDELITIQHLGGEAIKANQLTITIDKDGTIIALGGASLAQGFADGEFTIGEVWHLETLINENSEINMQLVVTGGSSSQLVAAQVISVADACSIDTSAPYPTTWVQTPADVSATHNGTVTVKVTVADSCSIVDQGAPVKLEYRINNGGAPSFSSVNMTLIGTSQWQGAIPDQTWASQGGRTLEYRVSGLEDEEGNFGTSNQISDIIQLLGIDTLVLSFNATHGSVSNFANMQSQIDGKLTGSITESPPDPPTPYYSNFGSGSGGGGQSNIEGAPDDVRYSITKSNQYSESRQQNVAGGAGTIIKVEAVFEAHYTGPRIDDTVVFQVQPTGGSWINVASNVIPNSGTDARLRVDVTGLDLSGSWSWDDVKDSRIRLNYNQYATEDLMEVKIDALWFEVTTTGSAPKSNVEFRFEPLPPSVNHVIDVNYRAAGNIFALEVWDGANWNVRGPSLNAPALTSATYPLTATEALANSGSPLIRITSTNVPTSPADKIFIDYIKVTSA
jgi:FlaG/FlaF family flagellin (archaellin)